MSHSNYGMGDCQLDRVTNCNIIRSVKFWLLSIEQEGDRCSICDDDDDDVYVSRCFKCKSQMSLTLSFSTHWRWMKMISRHWKWNNAYWLILQLFRTSSLSCLNNVSFQRLMTVPGMLATSHSFLEKECQTMSLKDTRGFSEHWAARKWHLSKWTFFQIAWK
jgi:hypothetical protein